MRVNHNENRLIKANRKLCHEARCKRDLARFREQVEKGKRVPKVRDAQLDRKAKAAQVKANQWVMKI